ncbi:glycosyltransferase family 9 protein [Pectobacterium parmentieri]|uniref:Glycosyltransferase family 9 protein n=1 Tax=Pectobacterium parmentieri TaxID=1905730 RepID=A0ABS0RYR9_PECPM|nr:glycosyltransferase family 9 protein [Pectobacterium parmentieri]MBI0471267.1 glycosyltransferase family 9 protein [Pectobacterium parmentieri]MBI0493879.1 glycosyltransferase family 9 protein [Pectobacterium parmentieri]MBI0554699.1 glycosyltransferase family 9 protein [Pectobacterium parmentieri]MBI0568145.1 glycosyltransferase family 9 protein [Pectobacterium parmentieri]MBI0573114.1 glycosyltransferase family 9 protein [Pectobacterium parmentieri]
MRTLTLQGCRKALCRSLFRLLADRYPPQKETPARPHIIVPRWDAKLGDAVVSSFFLREAARLNARLTVLTVAELMPLHKQFFGVEEVMVTSANPGAGELIRLARQLGPVDIVVHLVGRLQPVEILFFYLLRPSHIYSLDDGLRCVNHKLGSVAAGMNVVERYHQVLHDLGAETINSDYIIPLPTHLPTPDTAPQILFNPWASREDKSLSPTCAVMTLRAIATAFPTYRIGILYSPRTRIQAHKLENTVACANVSHVENITSLFDVTGYLCRAQVVISVDTAIVHLAVGLKKRLIAIYPGSPSEANPWLPPPSALTAVIYSPQTRSMATVVQKEMNNFSLPLLLDALRERVVPTSHRADHLSLQAKIIPGLGVATGTLTRQLPLIAQDFPEIADCYPGTLNLRLELPLELIHPDHRTPPLAWTPSGRTREVFDLLRVELEFSHLPTPVGAWLYVAHLSPHRATPTLHEVIAPKLVLGDVRQCRVHLPYSAVGLLADIPQANSSISNSLSASQ